VNKTDAGFYVTIIGSLITIVGFIITILQIMKTKKISNAAYSAALEAKSAIKNTIAISNLSARVKSIQEIQNDILHEKNDVAYLHTKDLLHALIEIRQLTVSKEHNENEEITKMITQLGILQRQLESAIYKKDKIDVLKANRKLSEFGIELSELSTKIKFPISGGDK
jgi:ppGpp synthetase/RelA/SpoT-type nucleotidyltranferase